MTTQIASIYSTFHLDCSLPPPGTEDTAILEGGRGGDTILCTSKHTVSARECLLSGSRWMEQYQSSSAHFCHLQASQDPRDKASLGRTGIIFSCGESKAPVLSNRLWRFASHGMYAWRATGDSDTSGRQKHFQTRDGLEFTNGYNLTNRAVVLSLAAH